LIKNKGWKKMSIGFRKSLLGFNCNDVLDYIERTHKNFKDKENKLNSQLDSVKEELSISKADFEKLMAEKAVVDAKLAEFNAKYDEIERLSENIGKLYLVAQTNAQAVMSSSEESAKISFEEVNKNIISIDEAHESLKEIRAEITKTSEEFVAEVDRLMNSLSATKIQIAENKDTCETAEREFAEVYETIVK
jgi:DNA repair exonuclease SbcCD ATPase subunit